MTTNENGNYTGKVAFVTGAANGIGRATALAFAREGANVVIADVSEQGNQETARMIEDLGGRAIAVKCDVTRTEDVKVALDKTIETFSCARVNRCSDGNLGNTRLENSPTMSSDCKEGD